MARKPKGYEGTEVTTLELKNLLPKMLQKMAEVHKVRPDLILEAWPKIVGKKLSPMTKATSFEMGVLFVKVANSTLYSLLALHEKKRLLQVLRETFPGVEIKNIVFRLG